MTALSWAPDGAHLACGAGRRIIVADLAHDSEATVRFRGDDVAAVALSPDGVRLVAGGGDTIRLWGDDLSTSGARLKGHSDVGDRGGVVAGRWAARQPPASTACTCGGRRPAGAAGPLPSSSGPSSGTPGWIGAVAWSPDGSRLAGTGNDGTLRLWDPGSGAETACIDTDHRDRVHSVAWSADGHHLATCDDTGLVIIWDRAGNEITSLVLQPSQCLAWGAFLAVGQPGEPALLTLRDPADLSD